MAKWSRQKKYRKRRAFLLTGCAIAMLILGCATGNVEHLKIFALFVILAITEWVGLLLSK